MAKKQKPEKGSADGTKITYFTFQQIKDSQRNKGTTASDTKVNRERRAK